jgi:hypothetical protein
MSSEVADNNGSGNEQLFTDLGLSITISQENYAAVKNRNSNQNGFLQASMEFEDETKPWLYFLPDGDNLDALNWIRVGTYSNNELGNCVDNSNDDYVDWDDNQYYEKILGGTWAPYFFTSDGLYGLSLKSARTIQTIFKFEPLSSVDLVITSDTSKWTRCCVVEMRDNEWIEDEECGFLEQVVPLQNYQSIGGAEKFTLRRDRSVDKMGNPIPGDTTHGLGWFPGYAIDHRTGERLNIVFGEDSWLVGDNGADMKWNPSSSIYSTTGPLFGGKHYIYIMGNNQNQVANRNAPSYDSCQWIYNNLINYEQSGVASTSLNLAWMSAMWVSIPLQNPDFDFLATDVKIKLRVATPYHKGLNEFAVEEPENDNFPFFSFTTADVKTIKADNPTAVNALDLIRVVPNPYYGNSYYEQNQLDNYVRITNLPQTCTISIYNASGILVRKIKKDNDDPFVEWDLKNTYGISIASGVYIVHINAPGIGEKVVKWFGALRPVDLNNF